MAGFKAAVRYAKGLFTFAKENANATEVYNEMKGLAKSLKENRELIVFLGSPVIENKKKVAISKEIFKGFSATTVSFINLLIKHGRGNLLGLVAERYVDLYNIDNNIKTAEITSAVALDKKSLDLILANAGIEFDQDTQIDLKTKVDESLIGGFILRVGDQQVDASIKHKLNQFKNQFDNDDYVVKF